MICFFPSKTNVCVFHVPKERGDDDGNLHFPSQFDQYWDPLDGLIILNPQGLMLKSTCFGGLKPHIVMLIPSVHALLLDASEAVPQLLDKPHAEVLVMVR